MSLGGSERSAERSVTYTRHDRESKIIAAPDREWIISLDKGRDDYLSDQ